MGVPPPSARKVEDLLRRGGGQADPHRQPHRIQAHGRVPGAGRQLGLVREEDPRGGPAHQSAEPVRLHRRRYAGLCGGGGHRLPCGCLQGHRGLGQGQRRRQRPGRQTHPLAGGRLRQVRRPREAARQHLRRHHHGPAELWPRPRRRDLEAGRLHLRPRQPVRRSAERQAALLCRQQLHHRPVARRHGVYAPHDAGAPLWRQDQLR